MDILQDEYDDVTFTTHPPVVEAIRQSSVGLVYFFVLAYSGCWSHGCNKLNDNWIQNILKET